MGNNETFGKRMKKLEKKMEEIDKKKGVKVKKPFMTTYTREVGEVDSN
jgi:hypothetical protein